MITATIITRKKVKGVASETKEIKLFNSTEQARKVLKPIAVDMQVCKAKKIQPEVEIVGVSFDYDSEKRMLLEIRAYTSIENEEPLY